MSKKTSHSENMEPLLLLDIHHSGYFGWGVWVSPDAIEHWTAETVERMMRNPRYKMGLNLGAHTYENSPELAPRIRSWMTSFPDRLFVTGGDYAQPTACVRSGESNLRHLLVGWEEIRRQLGVRVDIWTVSEPGNFAQLPQILKNLGYRGALLRIHGPGQLGSPVPTSDSASVWWTGPDSTKILAVPEYSGDRLQKGDACTYSMWIMTRYRNTRATRGNYTLDDLWNWKIAQERKGISPVVMSKDDDHNNQYTNNNLCMDSGHALAADTENDPRFRWVTAEELFEAVPTPTCSLAADPNLFETRVSSFCDYGFMGNRDWVVDHRAEAELRMGDFSRALAATLLGDVPGEKEMREAWKLHLGAQNHDVSLKSLSTVMYHLQHEASRIARGVSGRVLRTIAGEIETGDGFGAVVVWNPLAFQRREYATVTLPKEMASKAALHLGETPIQWEVVSEEAENVEMGFVADVPSLGYQTYAVRPGAQAETRCAARVEGRTITTPHFSVTFGERGGIDGLVLKGSEQSVVVPGTVGLSGDIAGERVRSGGNLEIEVGRVSAVARESGWLGKFHRFEITYRVVPDVPYITVHVHIWPEFAEGTPGAPGRAGDPGEKVRFVATLNPDLGRIRCVRQQPLLIWEYDPSLSPVFAALEWVDYQGTDLGLALLNDGAIGQSVDGTASEVGAILLNGGISDYHGDLAFMPHRSDWRGGTVHEAGQCFGSPLNGVFEVSHPGRLPKRFSLASVTPRNVTVSSVFRERGKTYARVWEHSGERARVQFSREGVLLQAERVNLRLRKCAGGSNLEPRRIAVFRIG